MHMAAMLIRAIDSILDRDLDTLLREVEAYTEERDLWRTGPGITNSAGTLVLHLAGNLQHYFGTRLAETGYIRDRAAEFTRRDVPKAELLGEIEAARRAVHSALARLTDQQLTQEFPETIADVRLTTGEYLMHLTTHFAYHLGQIDYHRRMVTGSNTVVGAMRPVSLSSARAAGVQA
jgi:uncharacterized damage-inducible protein DinB